MRVPSIYTNKHRLSEINIIFIGLKDVVKNK